MSCPAAYLSSINPFSDLHLKPPQLTIFTR